MRSTRRAVFVGATAGAFAIHLAMMACGTMSTPRDAGGEDVVRADAAPNTDGFTFDGMTFDGALDALAEAARDVTAAEMGTAEAGGMDGGGTCTCPPPPARPARSFTFTFDRGRGVERPRGEYSNFRFDVLPDLANGVDPYIGVGAEMRWYLADGRQISLTCGFQLTPDGRTILTSPFGPRCDLTVPSAGGGSVPANGRANLPVASITLTSVTETNVEVRIAPFTITLDAGAGSWSFSGLVLRTSDPNARYVTPPNFVAP